LIGRRVALIVANAIAARVVKTATTTVPIVFASGGDPVKDGLVTSIKRPGRNITGVVFFSETMGTKRLELLRQLVPNETTIGVLVNTATPGTEEERGKRCLGGPKVEYSLTPDCRGRETPPRVSNPWRGFPLGAGHVSPSARA
jgi:hypothetical protein